MVMLILVVYLRRSKSILFLNIVARLSLEPVSRSDLADRQTTGSQVRHTQHFNRQQKINILKFHYSFRFGLKVWVNIASGMSLKGTGLVDRLKKLGVEIWNGSKLLYRNTREANAISKRKKYQMKIALGMLLIFCQRGVTYN